MVLRKTGALSDGTVGRPDVVGGEVFWGKNASGAHCERPGAELFFRTAAQPRPDHEESGGLEDAGRPRCGPGSRSTTTIVPSVHSGHLLMSTPVSCRSKASGSLGTSLRPSSLACNSVRQRSRRASLTRLPRKP